MVEQFELSSPIFSKERSEPALEVPVKRAETNGCDPEPGYPLAGQGWESQ
jgi:hypothetical protein